MTKISYKKAGKKDAEKISQLVGDEYSVKTVLRRSPEEISSCVFFTAWLDGELVGTTGYKIWPEDGPEIIGHVVKNYLRGQGIGSELIKLCLIDLKAKGFQGAFALTINPQGFSKRGFYEINRTSLSQKLKTDCQFCPKRIGNWNDPQCGETAMRVNL